MIIYEKSSQTDEWWCTRERAKTSPKGMRLRESQYLLQQLMTKWHLVYSSTTRGDHKRLPLSWSRGDNTFTNTKGVSHRWSFFMRTISDIAEYFAPLERMIMHMLIPALLGRPVNQHERDILELPVRCGRLCIINPVRITSFEYAYSVAVTKDLVSLINQQDPDFT